MTTGLPQIDPAASEQRTIHVDLGIVASYSSPLPPASELRQLENLVPGATDRLIKLQERVLGMAETEQSQRHTIEARNENRRDRGQIFGFIAFFVLVVVIVILALTGNGTVAGIVAGTTVIGVVGLFIVGHWSRGQGAPPPSGGGT